MGAKGSSHNTVDRALERLSSIGVQQVLAAVNRLISAWQQVTKRSLAHWRLLSSVVLGVLLAAAIMSGTVIYFDGLRELALKQAFAKHTTTELDILVQTERGPTTADEYNKVSVVTEGQIDRHVAWMLRDRIRAGKSPTFFVTTPGNEALAGDDNARSYFAFLPRLGDQVTILTGGFPSEQRLNGPGEPLELEALIPQEAAILFDLSVGDRLAAAPPWNAALPYVTVVVSGVFQRKNPRDEFWYLEESVLESATGPSFRTVPLHIPEKSFMELLGPSLPKMDTTYAWLLAVDIGRVNARNADLTLANIVAMHGTLASTLTSYRQDTAVDNALREYDRRLFFSKLPMFVVLILIAVVILYYVVTLSSLVVEDRRSEVALLRSRGATSTQILTVFVLEGLTIAGLAVVAGPLLAATTISVLGFTPAFSDLTGGSRLAVSISSGAYLMSALGGALSFVALIVPAVQASRIGVTQHRQQSARPSSQPVFQRYYVDVMLLVLSIFLFRQLTEQGSVVATRLFGDVVVDQLLLAVPGLLLVASTMVLLRLFPLVLNLGSRLLSSLLPSGLVLGMWQMARNPTHYARLSLLLILTAGLGIFASSFGATLELSFKERVLYVTGSDVRIEGVSPVSTRSPRTRRSFGSTGTVQPPMSVSDLIGTYEQVSGVDRASPVLRATGQDLAKFYGQNYVMFAVDGETFGDVAWFREDFSDEPMVGLLKSLEAANPPQGVPLPAGARSIGVRLKADRPHPSVRVTARIKNAQDRYFTYRLGALDSRGWAVLETSLGFRTGQSPESSLPLTLVSLRVHESAPARRLQAGSIIIDDVWVRTAAGETTVVEEFNDADDWSLLKVNEESISDVVRASDISSNGDSGSVLFSWSEGSALTARGIFHGPPRSPLPVLASEAFARETNHSPEEEFEVSAAGYRIPVRMIDTIDLFPTMNELDANFLVADLTSLTRYANLGAISRELLPNAIWLSTSANGIPRPELVEDLENVTGYSSQAIIDREERLDRSKVDPLVQAGWRSLLFIAFAAVLILSCLGFLVHAYVSFRNRQLEFALLRTVGFSMRQLITMVWLEQILVIAVGLALGTWMGGRLGAIIMPFLGHDDWGGQVIPPFVLEVNWGALLATYAVMVLVFAAITIGLVWLIRKISLQRILRLGEM